MKYITLIFLIIAMQRGIAQVSQSYKNFPTDTHLEIDMKVKDGKFQFMITDVDSVKKAIVKTFTFEDEKGKEIKGFTSSDGTKANTVLFSYAGDLAPPKNVKVKKGDEVQLILEIKEAVKKESSDITEFKRSDYISTIKNYLNSDTTGVRNGAQFNPEEVLRITEDGKNVVYLFLDHKSIMAPGTAFPSCTSGDTYFKVIYIYPGDLENEGVNLDVTFTADALAVSEENDLKFSSSQEDNGAKNLLLVKASKRFGPYPTGVEIKVSVKVDADTEYKPEGGKITISQCNVYQVSIAGGFFASTLNNPSNVKDGVSSDGTTTLFADHARWQRALTIMAIFYPVPRKFGYDYKSLSFWQKWSVCFGTQLSENLFDDLLLGLNYEVSKGLGFSMGVHYGEHSVLSGYPKFRYGKDQFDKGTFSNTMMSNQWDFGLYAGVNLDLRVIAQLRNNGRAQKTANDNK